MKRGTALAAAAVALLSAGCGSTVSSLTTEQNGGQGATTGPGGVTSSTGPGGLAGPAGGANGGVNGVGGVNGSGGTGTGSSTLASTTGGSNVGGTVGQQAGYGPGITPTAIYVGAAYDPDAAQADAALGAANADPGDLKIEQQAVFNYINAHGGIAHRKIVPVWYKASVAKDTSTTYQEACAAWTQDAKTFLMLSGDPLLDQCIANAHNFGLTAGIIAAEDTQIHQRFPADLNLTGYSIDTAMRVTVNGLARQGYFAKGAKVGIATWDAPEYAWSIQHGAVPALAAQGLHNVPVKYITVPQSYGDLGATSASVQNAVLQFRSQGINHVILFDGVAGVNNSGVLVLEWMQGANSQHYYPKYGLNSTSAFSGLAGDYPEKEMEGSIGVSWLPFLDLAESDYQPNQYTAQMKLCLKIEADAGQKATNNNQRAVQIGICDTYFFAKRLLESIRGPINQATALAAANAIRGSWQPMTTFGAYIDANHHDGASLVRNIAFVPSCTCYRYTSAPYNAR